jgi:putative thioredoxin
MNPPTAAILDVTVATFQAEVVDRSRTMPVLLDLWATWCGPCKALSPTLEKITREMAGRLVLAKVDIDENPEIADALGAQSIPTVALLVGGKIVDGFVGAQPEAQIREMLARHLGPPRPDAIEEALALGKAGDVQGAVAALRSRLLERPEQNDVRAQLARLLILAGLDDEGRRMLDALPLEAQETEPARAARALLEIKKNRVDPVPLRAAVAKNPGDIAARLALGRALLAGNEPEEGLEMMLEAAKRDLKFDGGAPRTALLEAFEALGDASPLVTRYRRELSLLLCS